MMYFWIAVIVGTLLLEIGHPSLFLFLSFSLGASIALITSLMSLSLFMQIITFITTTLVCIVLLRNLSHILNKKEMYTNMQALIGSHALVIKEITPNKVGQIKVNGEIWSARTTIDNTFKPHDYVLIKRISGSHAFVTHISHRKEQP